MTYIKDYLSAYQAIDKEFQKIDLRSPSPEVCKAAEQSAKIVSAFATQHPEGVSDLEQAYYIIAKEHVPLALKDLEARIDTQNKKISQATKDEDVNELNNPALTAEAEALKKQHTALTALFKDTLEIEETGCFACFKAIFTYFFYARPVQKQIDKVEAALDRLQLLETARRQKIADLYQVAEESLSKGLDDFEKAVEAFEKMVLEYTDVIFPTSFIDTFNKLQRQEMVLSRQFNRLKSIDSNSEFSERFNKQQIRHIQIFLRVSNFYDAMDLFQSLHRGIQYNSLSMLATGDEGRRRHRECLRVISPEQIKRALAFPFAWGKLAEFADFQLRFLLREQHDFALDSPERIYIQKLKLLVELIPQFRSKLLADAVSLETVLTANEHPAAVVNTRSPPPKEPPTQVETTAHFSLPVQKEESRFDRFIRRAKAAFA